MRPKIVVFDEQWKMKIKRLGRSHEGHAKKISWHWFDFASDEILE